MKKKTPKQQTYLEYCRELDNVPTVELEKQLIQCTENGLKELISTALAHVQDDSIREELTLILIDSREFKIQLLGIKNKHALEDEILINDLIDIFNVKYFIKNNDLPPTITMALAMEKFSSIMCRNLLFNKTLFFEELAKVMRFEKNATPSKVKTASLLSKILGRNETELSELRKELAPSKVKNPKKIAEKHQNYEALKKAIQRHTKHRKNLKPSIYSDLFVNS